MFISVRVTPNAKKNEIIKISDNSYKIKVTAPPEKGRANELVLELLAEHLNKKRREISIMAGKTSRDKIIEVI